MTQFVRTGRGADTTPRTEWQRQKRDGTRILPMYDTRPLWKRLLGVGR